MRILFTMSLVTMLLLLSINSIAQIPAFQWAKSFGSTANDDGRSVAVNDFGNVYTVGSFSGTVDFDPGAGTFNLTAISTDVFVSKLDANGSFVWAKKMGGTGAETAFDIALDAAGNIYTTGVFEVTADFDPGSAVFNLIAGGNQNIFISKLDANGNFVWAKNMNGTGSSGRGLSIALDAAGNIYTTGYFSDNADFDPGPAVFSLVTVSSITNVFVSKLDAAGNFVWAKKMGGTAVSTSAAANSIAVDAFGNVYTTGVFKGVCDFDPGAGAFSFTASTSFTDIFISKLDASGNFVWAKRIGGTQEEVARSIALDAASNVFIVGSFQNSVDFDPGAGIVLISSVPINRTDIFTVKLDAAGNYIWANRVGGAQSDLAYSIAIDATGNLYTTGLFQSTVDFDPGAGITNITGEGIYISKLDNAGNFVWALRLTSFADLPAIALDVYGNIYTTGGFTSPFDADPGAGIYTLTPQSSNYDAFVHKMSPPGLVPPAIVSFAPASGFSGSLITITGSNFSRLDNGPDFTAVTAVRIGGTNATSFTVVDANTVTAVVASGSTGTVSLINSDGAAVSASSFTYNGYISASDGNWTNPATWLGGSVPVAGASVTVNHNVYLSTGITVTTGKTILVNGRIDCGNNIISGAGSFMLSADATFATGNAAGINASITAVKTLSSLANYIFNGTVSQTTAGMPVTVKTLGIANTGPSGSNKVTLSQPVLNISGAANSLLLQAGLLVSTGEIFMPLNGQVISTGGNFNPQYTGYIHCGNGGNVSMSGAISFNNIDVFNNTDVTFSGAVVINHILDLKAGAGMIIGSPFYQDGSELRYSNGSSYTRGDEWNAMNGPGYPCQVFVGTHLMINNGNPAALIGCSNSLTIGGVLDMTGMRAPLTVYFLLDDGSAERSVILSDQPGGDLKLTGPYYVNLTNFTTNGRKVVFTGENEQSIGGNETALKFEYLVIDKTASYVFLNNDIKVEHELALNSGILKTTYNKVIMAASANITGSGTGNYIYGNLQRGLNAGSSSVGFPVGDATTYRPVSIDFNAVPAGNLLVAVSAYEGDHPEINSSTLNPDRSVNRFWKLTDVDGSLTSGTYNANFEFAESDKDILVDPAHLLIGKFVDAAWTYPDITAVDGLHTKALNVSGFGDFAIAESLNPVVICAVTASVTTTAATCFGSSNGTATITLAGIGSGSAGTYTVDAGIVQSFSSNPFIITGLSAGNHIVAATITAGGCSVENVLFNIAGPLATLAATYTSTNLSQCNAGAQDGTISILAAGGTAPYTYHWTGITGSGNPATAVFADPGNVSALTGLNYGYYNVVVTDANNCSTVTLNNIHIAFAYSVYVTSSGSVSSSCGNTGIVNLHGNAGVLPYMYSLNGINYQSVNSFSGLSAGTYTGYVKDAGGCVSTKPGIVVGAANAITVTPFARQASSCANDGTIEVYRSGGIPPYTYSLNNIIYTTANVFNGLAAGNYTAYVKDSKGCIGSQAVIVSQGTALGISVIKINTSTCVNDGSIQVNAAGGIALYMYSKDGGITYQPGNAFSGLPAGNYIVAVKDTKNCLGSINVTISTAAIVVTSFVAAASNCVTANGVIQLFRSGGAGPYTYSLDGNTYQSSNIFNGKASGNYVGYVKDSKTCVGILSNIVVGPNCFPGFAKNRNTIIAQTEKIIATEVTGIRVYPNPSNNEFNLLNDLKDSKGKVYITVSDISGRKIMQFESYTTAIKFGKELQAGIYVLELVQGNLKQLIMLMKE